MKVFVYQWFVGDELNENGHHQIAIRAYGLTEKDFKTVCIHIKGFTPWFFLEMASSTNQTVDWTASLNMVKNKITDRYKGPVLKPFSLCYKQKLYFHHGDKKFPFLKVGFPSIQSRRSAYYKLQQYSTFLFGKQMEMLVHEEDVPPFLQFITKRNLPSTGWIEFHGKSLPSSQKITRLDGEYLVEYTNVSPVEEAEALLVPPVTIFSFDIECYSMNPNRMCDATIDGDVVFQIACCVEHQDKRVSKHLLSLGNVVLADKQIDVRCFVDESRLLLGFQKLLTEVNPHVVIGYNIFGFDIQYLVERARRHDIMAEIDLWGIPFMKHSELKEIKWSSSAYQHQSFQFLNGEGRVFVDLLPVIKRDYKFSNYKLKTVSSFFLGETKDPLTHLDIFDAYRQAVLQKTSTKKLNECAKYCVQDALLVLRLFKKLETWIGLVEMARSVMSPSCPSSPRGNRSRFSVRCMRNA